MVLWALLAACSASAVGDDDYDGRRPDASDDGLRVDGTDDGGDDMAGGDADEGDAGDGDEDGGGDSTCTLAAFGERCAVHADCCPGLVCFAPRDDSRPSICTQWCDGECPEGYGCRVFDDGSGGEAEVCWYPAETMCDACTENAQCGEVRDWCIGMPTPDDDTFCSIYCDPADPDGCPDEFHCAEIPAEIPGYQCMPDDGVCCIDRDDDGYGQGAGCIDTDCIDGDPTIHPGADEVCDGVDNDCDTGIDNGPNSCGTCRRCTGGTCTVVAAGDDPYEECPAANCDPWYWGWADGTNTCYHMGLVPATLAACDGAGACRTTEAECNLHHLQGTEQITCNGTIGVCQLREGCAGAAPGMCANQDLGAAECGVGECLRSVERCVGGVEQTCVPGVARAETCNDLDDDCDGQTDISAAFAVDTYEPNESCGAQANLGAIMAPVTGMSISGSPTIYPDGDADYYVLFAREPTDSPVDCIPVLCQENYELVLTLVRPPDAPGLQLCASASSCAGEGCTGGSSQTLTWTGTCGGLDDRNVYFSVRGPGGGQFDCHPYDVRISFRAWLTTASWPGCPGA
jgi:hypothetical protein